MISSILKFLFIAFIAYFPLSIIYKIFVGGEKNNPYGFKVYKDYKEICQHKEAIKMKYKRIKTLYQLNSNRWDWGYHYSSPYFWYTTNENEKIYIYVSHKDYCRLIYEWTHHKEEDFSSNSDRDRKMKAILQTAQLDIDNLKTEATNQINNATKTISKVCENLKLK